MDTQGTILLAELNEAKMWLENGKIALEKSYAAQKSQAEDVQKARDERDEFKKALQEANEALVACEEVEAVVEKIEKLLTHACQVLSDGIYTPYANDLSLCPMCTSKSTCLWN
jgi:CRISPR/Cas system CMR subunit Cmr6 (Cas7 group RAMP superfamily)